MYDYTEYLANFRKTYINGLDGNGFLAAYQEDIYKAVAAYLKANQPLHKSVYDALPEAERKRMGPTAWHVGWQSGSQARNGISAIKRAYAAKAQADAEADRKASGWTGRRHMTAPTGQKISRNGMSMGQYASGKDYEGSSTRTDSFTPAEIHNLLLGLDVRMTELAERIDELEVGA